MYYVWQKHNCFGIDRRPIVVNNTFLTNLKNLAYILESTQTDTKMYYESLNNATMRDSMYPIPKVHINREILT